MTNHIQNNKGPRFEAPHNKHNIPLIQYFPYPIHQVSPIKSIKAVKLFLGQQI